jgi:hypothetical protein
MGYIVKKYMPVVILLMTLSALASFCLLGNQKVEAAVKPTESPNIKIFIDEQPLDTKDSVVLVSNNRTLLPFRVILEGLGATVNWDNTAKTASATLGTTTLKLKLNSTTAYKNGAAVTMDTAVLGYKDRVYIPLRFASEALGSTVFWDSSSKNVYITSQNTGSEPEPILEPVIKINGYAMALTSPLYKAGTTGSLYVSVDDYMEHLSRYLPAEYFFSWSNDDKESYTILFDGVKRVFYPEKDYYLQNDENKALNNKLILVNGIVYIPLAFSQEVLGGSISYNSSTNTTNISINRPKFKTEFVEKETVENYIPVLVEKATMDGDRIFSISDNPEVLNSSSIPLFGDSIIMQTDISTKNNTSEHRVFGWHINKMGKRLKLGIVIENTGSSAIKIDKASVVSRTTFNTWYNYDVGMPLAEALLSNQMSDINTDDNILPAGASKLLHSFTLSDTQMVGFILDLDLVKSGSSKGLNYQIRVVVSTDDSTDLQSISGDNLIADTVSTYPRGTWESSEIYAELPTYEVGSDEVSYSISNGITDNLFTKDNSLDSRDQTVDNIGHFGVIYKTRLTFDNNGGQDRTVRIRLVGRGGNYSCAVKTPDGVFLTPILKPHKEAAIVYQFTPPSGTSYLDLQIIHAGGSDLPVAINILTL